MLEQATIIVNPHARQGHAAALLPQMQKYVRDERLHATVVACDTFQSLARVFAGLPRGSRVVGVGGDGTNHQLLPFLLAGEHSYGLVPYGSGNDVARTLGLLEMSWQDALRHALSADTVHVDVAVVHDEEGARQRHFLGCFLLGIDGHISNQTQNWKFRGPIPYFVTLLKELPRLRGWNLQVHWETSSGARQHQDGWMLLCSLLNTPTYGSGYPIAPMASMTDGALNLLIAPTVAWWRFLLLFFKMLRGTHLTDPVVRLDDVRHMRVQSPSPLCLSADGERLDWQCNSLAIRMLPKRLAVVAIGR